MALIRREDVDAVRERARIDEIVSAHVTLKSAGVGSLKGLCPFHDERTPSFHVRPAAGRWHCFGCNEGGDVISFVQKIDGLGFAEAVEYLAGRVGIQVRYEEADGSKAQRRPEDPGRRRRLIDANATAAQFYTAQLFSPGAVAARTFLAERSFERVDAERFGVGYAPTGWDNLTRHLQGKGFTQAELLAAGLVSEGRRGGVYDRFRGRLVWPIRDVTGEVIGFGARRLYDEDTGPKYLNTPETPLYKKSQVLYGIDLARREIAKTKRVVVVEGYTDVMAAHLSGVGTAIATCGTAFGSDHTRIVRRLMGDSAVGGGVQLAGGGSVGGEVVFTFDGDAAGRQAALRAFGEDQRFLAQTFVAVEPTGMDPCDLRMAHGPDAVRALVDSRQPLFEFVIRSTLASFDLDTAEGRVGALRATAPIIAGIRDAALRPEYARMLSGWVGMRESVVLREVSEAAKRPAPASARAGTNGSARANEPGEAHGAGLGGSMAAGAGSDASARSEAPTIPLPDPRNPVARLERQALIGVVQFPHLVPPGFDSLPPDAFVTPAWRAIQGAVHAAGGVAAGAQMAPDVWAANVVDRVPPSLVAVATELAVAPLPEDREEMIGEYVAGVVRSVVDAMLARRIADAKGHLQRLDPRADAEAYQQAFTRLLEVENQRRVLKDDA